MKGKVLFCLFIIIFSFTSVFYGQTESQVQPQSEEELSLFEIDKLIRKTEYDEALRQLNIYMDKNPEQFDNAQKRINKIMTAKIKYSELAEDLLYIIRNDPTNNKRIYEITAELERFERNPSDENLKFIADLKKSAEFNYFRALFLEIQNDIAENVKKEKYVDCIARAQEGFWLYQENFYVDWEDYPEIISNVENIVNDLNVHLAMFQEKNFIPDIENAVNEFIKAVDADQYEIALQKFDVVNEKMIEFNNVRTLIINDKAKMETTLDDLRKINPDITDASYLPFLIHFITGAEAIENSGILGAVDGQWNYFLKNMNSSVFAMTSKKYKSFKKPINKNFTASVKKYADLNLSVLGLYDLPNKNSSIKINNPLTDYEMLSAYISKLTQASGDVVDLQNFVNNNGKTQENIINNIARLNAEEDQIANINLLIDYSKVLEDKTGVKEQSEADYNSWSLEYNNSDYKNWDKLTKEFKSLVASIYDTKDGILKNTWNTVSEFYKGKSENLYTELVAYLTSAENYKNGFFAKVPAEAIEVINKDITKATYYEAKYNVDTGLNLGLHYCYPNIAIKISEFVNREIDLRVGRIKEYLTSINENYKSHESWANVDEISNAVQSANDYLNQQIKNILSLRKKSNNIQKIAKEMIMSSELAKNEADIRFAEAELALEREDFPSARKKLQNSLTKYDEALNNQDNENLRNEWDAKLKDLGERITRAENELIVKQVRDLKDEAKDAYFNGRFDDAEQLLTQASIKWSITNVTEDPEIVNLLNFVNTAISMKTGREILPSAPQYPEMSQLLNTAHQSFDEGKRLMAKGMKKQAFEKFDIALDNIRKVQYVYPLNQEASLLTLEINKIKDPKKFKDEFAQKIQTARTMCKNPKTRQEGYSNLLDYYKLDPSYPGLKQLIYDIEIEIGIRQKPVDNSGRKKADSYIREAQNLYNKANGDPTILGKALDKINQALAINPDNAAAKSLKDKITTKKGGNAPTVLSTEDERLYQLAIQRLQNNNIVGANAIVNELLKKPQNRYSQKIKDLKNKIEARS